MAKPNQGMLDNIDATSTRAIGAVGRLSTSATADLKTAFPGGPQFTGDTATTTVIDGIPVNMSRSDYREFYKTHVMSGDSNGVPEFGDATVNMDYSGAPSLGTITPDGEKAPGETGSTIVSTGLGPNVNVNGTLEDTPGTPELPDGVAANRAVVDAGSSSTAPFVGDGSASPHATKTPIGNGGVHGGGALGNSPTTGG